MPFRNGPLGNSVLAEPHRLGKVSWRQLQSFVKSRLVSSEGAIVAVNVDHGVLLRYGTEQSSIPDGSGKTATESKYLGGDERLNTNSSLAHVLIAGNGAKLADIKSVAVHSVLSTVIGQGTGKASDVRTKKLCCRIQPGTFRSCGHWRRLEGR